MPRQRVHRLFPIMLSPAALADAMMCPLSKIKDAINSGVLIAHEGPNHSTRILVRDAVSWAEGWPIKRRQT